MCLGFLRERERERGKYSDKKLIHQNEGNLFLVDAKLLYQERKFYAILTVKETFEAREEWKILPVEKLLRCVIIS